MEKFKIYNTYAVPKEWKDPNFWTVPNEKLLEAYKKSPPPEEWYYEEDLYEDENGQTECG